MENQFTYYDKIDQYLANTMSRTERSDFEKELTSNAELKEEVASQKELRELVIGASLLDVRSMMDNDLESEIGSKKKNKGWWGLLGVALIALVGVGIYMTHDEPKENTKTTAIKNAPVLDTPIPEKSATEKSAESKPVLETKTEEKTPLATDQPEAIDDTSSTEKQELVDRENEPLVETTPLEKEDQLPAEKHVPVEAQIEPLSFKGEVKTVKSDYQKGNGQIVIDGNISGGEPPYSYFIFEDDLQLNKTFTNLEVGSYEVKAIDANERTITIAKIDIRESSCIADYNPSFIPAYDGEWKIPVVPNRAFNFKVFNLKGLVFEEYFESGDEAQWNGLSSNEQTSGIGYYRFEIIHENGDKCYGELTIGN